VSNSRQRLSARDYKHGGGNRADGFDIGKYKQFGLGLGIGLAVALAVWVQTQRLKPDEALTEPVADTTKVAPAEAADDTEKYDFYEMLPNFEVEVPEAERRASRNQPAAPITQPGAYVLQVGSFRNRPDAERQRDRLIKQGINAAIQHVTIDDNEWHRVRVGPSRELSVINSWREQLRASDVKFTVYQIEE
jgi:cell division protein FtsN